MKRLIAVLALLIGTFASCTMQLCWAAETPRSSISFGYQGLALADSNATGNPLTGLTAGLSFGLPGHVGSLDLEAAKGDVFKLATVDIAPGLGKYFYVPFGASYLDIAGEHQYGINAGIGVKLFPAQHLGLKLSLKGHHLRDGVLETPENPDGEQNWLAASAVAVVAF
jgi:hypothetical protein